MAVAKILVNKLMLMVLGCACTKCFTAGNRGRMSMSMEKKLQNGERPSIRTLLSGDDPAVDNVLAVMKSCWKMNRKTVVLSKLYNVY